MKLRTKYWKGFGFFWGVGVVVLVLLVVFLLVFFYKQPRLELG